MCRLYILVIFFICIVYLAGCSAIFETNIEDKRVVLIAPADSLRTNIATHTFWWNYVDGADKYNLEIVSPGFGDIERLILDTNTTGNKFSYTLIPGTYEWGVSAFNSGYNTQYTVNSLFIDSTTDLSAQQIILISPEQNLASANKLQKFKWLRIYSASAYHFEIKKNNWSGELVAMPVETTADTITILLSEGIYSWGVKAMNSISSSPYTVREFIIDLSSPLKPILELPVKGDTLHSTPVHLTWSRPDISGSTISDSVYIASDSAQFSTNITKSYKTNNTWYDVDPGENGVFFWRIRSIDAAGNKSEPSEIRKFNLEP
jgi:hypothetical protein